MLASEGGGLDSGTWVDMGGGVVAMGRVGVDRKEVHWDEMGAGGRR